MALLKTKISVDETNEYLAQLGHEMRSPLHSILGFSHMLAETCQEEAPRAWLNNIRTASKHLLDLVNDIIDINRLSTQPIEIADEPIDIFNLILDITSTLQPQTRIGQLSITTEIDANATQFWRGDKRKLKQIFINILSNAIKFTPPNGKVSIRISEVKERLKISVKDTGVGMDSDTLSHLFQPYFHSNSRINQQGTGLGLTITRRLIDLMHGEILVSSQPSDGSEFIVLLPLEKGKKSTQVTTKPKEEKLTKITHALLVDDDKLHHEILIDMVKSLPIVIHSAFNSEQTLELCSQIKPHLILLDYRLPDGDGLNLARMLRHCNNHLPNSQKATLAMLTAHRGDNLQEALADGTLDAVLYKPLELAALIQLAIKAHPNTILSRGMPEKTVSMLSAPDYLQSLWPEFYHSLEEGIYECQTQLEHKLYKALGETAHKLKGQAMIFHHHYFWQQFEALETLAQAHNESMAVGLLTQILQTYQKERSVL